MARPFLKWAGGKRQLLPEIESRFPPDLEECSSYVEPLLGGGSVLFHTLASFNFEEVHVSDVNPELILCYKSIQRDALGVSEILQGLCSNYPTNKEGQKSFYYSVRDEWNEGVGSIGELAGESRLDRVARTIFLNKTCFNGLFRVNRKGMFNVPCNYTKNPSFPTGEELLDVQKALEGVEIREGNYGICEEVVDEGSFVYFDPPYRPISDTSGFVSYSKDDFDDGDQRELSALYRRLDSTGARVMLSNSDPRNSDPEDGFFDELYSGFNIERVMARRSINSVGGGRGKITEILVTNYEVKKWW